MKIKQETRQVEMIGVQEKGNFSIAATAQAFQILSDGLYSDKIKAIVRELSCNAHDAHVAAKNSKPFQIHLPSFIEPYFSVRDWGIGLSHEDVMTLYTTYFQSTKNESNDFTGCLGLGSKSPFSYTDQFTVVSWFNGTKRMYSAFLGEAGNPQITLMGEEPTDEHNGIEVKVTVESSDLDRFANKAREVLSRFDPKPTVIGCDDFEFNQVEYYVSGNGWKLRKMASHRLPGAVAIQGNVAYPIDISSIKNLTELEQIVLRLPLDITFELGELMVTASRETLSYGDKEPTSDSIRRKCAQIVQELPQTYQAQFDQCKTYWDAMVKYDELFNRSSSDLRAFLLNRNTSNITWDGESIGQPVNISLKDLNVQVLHFERRSRSFLDKGRARGRPVQTNFHEDWRLVPKATIHFFYDDVGRGSNTRVSYYMENELSEQRDGIYLIKTEDSVVLDQFKEYLGGAEIKPVSQLPKPQQQSSTGGNRQAGVKVYQYSGNHHQEWEATQLDFSSGGLYVPINRFRPVMNDDVLEAYTFRRINEVCVELGIFDENQTVIYGVYPRYAKKLKFDDNWTCLWDYLGEHLVKLIQDENVLEMKHYNEIYRKSSLPFWIQSWLKEEIIDLGKIKKKKSTFLNFAQTYNKVYEMSKANEKQNSIVKLAQYLEYSLTQTDNPIQIDLDDLWIKVLRTYPMVNLMDHRHSYEHDNVDTAQILIDYINQMD